MNNKTSHQNNKDQDFLIQNNLASQQQVSQQTGVVAKKPSQVLDLANYENHVLDQIDSLNQEWRNADRVLVHLNHLKNLFMIDVPMAFRPALFRLLNNLSSALMNGYGEHKEIFRACFNMMTQFKKQVDQAPQNDACLADNEWQEFERCVYILSDWEDLVQYGNEVAFVPLYAEIKN